MGGSEKCRERVRREREGRERREERRERIRERREGTVMRERERRGETERERDQYKKVAAAISQPPCVTRYLTFV